MPTLNIKDPEVYEMAKAIAARTNTTATGAVRDALREKLEQLNQDRSAMAEAILAISQRSAARPGEILADEDIYDQMGLPK